jgi:hypothetical protein
MCFQIQLAPLHLAIPRHKLASGVQLREALAACPDLQSLDASHTPVTTVGRCRLTL